jgi:hypothetical protein
MSAHIQSTHFTDALLPGEQPEIAHTQPTHFTDAMLPGEQPESAHTQPTHFTDAMLPGEPVAGPVEESQSQPALVEHTRRGDSRASAQA